MGRNYKNMKGENNPNYRNGYAIKGELKGFYNSWQNMKARCLRKTNPKYKNYGARGITICPEWIEIKGFAEWALANGWKEGLQLDRIDNNGNYCPENCRWVSVSENSRKKSTTKISFEQAQEIRERIERGESPYDLANEYGVVHGTIWFIQKNFTHVADGECSKKIKERKNANS